MSGIYRHAHIVAFLLCGHSFGREDHSRSLIGRLEVTLLGGPGGLHKQVNSGDSCGDSWGYYMVCRDY